MALVLQHHEREGDVLRRQPRSVMEARFGPQPVASASARPREVATLRATSPYSASGSSQRARHQRVEGQAHAGRAVALEHVDVQRVEGVEGLVAEVSARSAGPRRRPWARPASHSRNAVESGGVFQLAEGGQAVPRDARNLRPRVAGTLSAASMAAPPHAGRERRAGRALTCGDPVFLASSASHHQIVGKAGAEYLGMCRRPAETVPARRAGVGIGPLRNDEIVGQQHAVERLGCRHELVAVFGEDHPIDQRVDPRDP